MTNQVTARLATLKTLREDILPNFLNPVPTNETLRTWFDKARVSRLKSNPAAKRGGGKTFYLISAIEKLMRSGMLPGRLSPVSSARTLPQ